MKKKLKLILALSAFTVLVSYAQNGDFGIGTTTPNSSAALDITSASKGFLLPRMTTAARNSIVTPATGLQVFDTTLNSIWLYNGNTWVKVGPVKFVDGTTPADAVFTGGKVAIGTTTPATSAVLDLSSTTAGLLVPRMTSTQRSAIVSPANGLLIYNTTTNNLEMNTGTTAIPLWKAVMSDNFYNANGNLSSARTVQQGTNNLNFNSTATTGTSHFTVDGTTFNVDAVGNRVGFGTNAADPSSVIDVVSTAKGILIPRMSDAQRSAIASPAKGLLLYNLTTNILEMNTGSATVPAWKPVQTENFYNANGALTSTRTIQQGTYEINFATTATSGTSHFTIDGTTLNIDAVSNRIGINTSSPKVGLDIATTDAVKVPVGLTTERPITPLTGMVRFNSTTQKFEGYNGSTWTNLN